MTPAAYILVDLPGRDGRPVGTTIMKDFEPGGSGAVVVADIPFGADHDGRLQAWLERGRADGRAIHDCRSSDLALEVVTLHDGRELQHVVPGVSPVSHAARLIAQERARREARRGDAALPAGGLWDDVARQQRELFA